MYNATLFYYISEIADMFYSFLPSHSKKTKQQIKTGEVNILSPRLSLINLSFRYSVLNSVLIKQFFLSIDYFFALIR